MKKKELEQFVKDRNEAAWSLDPNKYFKFMSKYVEKGVYGVNFYANQLQFKKELILCVMAKACMNIDGTPEEVKKKAQAILDANGMDGSL